METFKMPVDAGLVNVEINDGDVLVGSFKFNPSDVDIIQRYKEIGERVKAIKIAEDASAEALNGVIEELKDATNYLLNSDCADEVYAKCSPLAVTASGDFFFETIVKGVADVVEKVTKKRLDKKNAKISRATAKYTKR